MKNIKSKLSIILAITLIITSFSFVAGNTDINAAKKCKHNHISVSFSQNSGSNTHSIKSKCKDCGAYVKIKKVKCFGDGTNYSAWKYKDTAYHARTVTCRCGRAKHVKAKHVFKKGQCVFCKYRKY